MRERGPRSAVSSGSLVLSLALLAGGCQGQIEDPAQSPGTGTGAAAGSGTTGGTGATGQGGTAAHGASGGITGKGGSSTSGGSAGATGGMQGSAASPAAFESVARRLTVSEIDATVRDVLGDASGPAAAVLSEDEFNPFDNDYTLQRASRALVDSLSAFAETVAARALTPANRGRVVTCTPASAGDTDCFDRTVANLGLRLFRRPLADDEVRAYRALQAFATEDNPHVENDFYTSVELALRSMLQDPEFLYRIELGTPEADPAVLGLNGYETATRLSYLLWGSAPDAELLSEAAGSALLSGSGRRRAAERLLDDPRARATLHRFHAMWLGYRAIPHSAELVRAFDRETSALIDRVVFDEPASYLELFLSAETYVDATLADHYGLPRPAGDAGWVSYGSTGRAGILSHGSVLAGFSKFSDTSPTQRGIFVQTRLLCNRVEAPPANVNVDQPPASGDSACKYDRYEAHRAIPSCAGCHAELDPIGFGLEAYDIGGRLREHDDGHPECAISGEGELPGYGTFSGPGELSELLVESGEIAHCFVQHWVSFALGRPVRSGETGAIDALAADFTSQAHVARELLLDFVQEDRFALRREEPLP